MIVSTKGRYAVRVMADIAQNSHGSFVPLKEVTKRQSIPQKYIEEIKQANVLIVSVKV